MARDILPAVVLPLTQGFVTIIDPDIAEWASKENWFASGTGHSVYAKRMVKRRAVYLHRLIANPPEGMVVDHINGNTLDNRRANLRLVSHAENMGNRRHSPEVVKERKGASFEPRTGKWQADIMRNGVKYRLGRFDTEEEAVAAYRAKAEELDLLKNSS